MRRGLKHTCKSCGTKYYDLEKANHACPKCGIVGALKSVSKYKKSVSRAKRRGATDKPEEQLKTLILFRVEGSNLKIGSDIDGRSFDLKFSDAEAGWYVTSASDTENNAIRSQDAVLFLSAAPLDGLIQFLSSSNFAGIGQGGASDLVREHGEIVLTSIVKTRDTIASELGVNKKKASALEVGWQKRLASNVLNIFLHEIGLSPLQVREVSSKYGADIVKTLRRNPFELVKAISRFGFIDVERVCERLHLEVSEEQQIIAACEYYLLERTEKRLRHTCLPKDNLVQRVSELLSKPEASIERTISANEDALVFGNRKNRVVVATTTSAARDDQLVKSLKKISKNYAPFSKKNERKISDFKVLDSPFDGTD
jgi:predicted  nucleic acid-binding Zn-ribbon protein